MVPANYDAHRSCTLGGLPNLTDVQQSISAQNRGRPQHVYPEWKDRWLTPDTPRIYAAEAITLLGFFSTMGDTLDTPRAYYVVDMRFSGYYRNNEARDVHEEPFRSVSDGSEDALYEEKTACIWNHVMDALRHRFLS